MRAREFMNRAYKLDRRIDNKLEMVATLNSLATKATLTITGMPHAPSGSKTPMADTVGRIIDLQNEINADIDALVDMKAEIISVIKAVDNIEYQMLLEQRYLCYHSWEEVATEMNYGIRWTHIMHTKALGAVDQVLAERERRKIS